MSQIRNNFSADLGTVIDEGNGVVTFPNGLVLNSGTAMRDGLRYDIASLDLSDYSGELFASHDYNNLGSLLGRLNGVQVRNGELIATGATFAIGAGSLQADLAYNMVVRGFLNKVSIGTIGFPANEQGVYENHSVYETSFVLVPNDPSAKINESPLALAVANGLDVTPFFGDNNTKKVEEQKELNVSKDTEVKQAEAVENKAAVDASAIDAAVEKALQSVSDRIEKQFKDQIESVTSGITSVTDSEAINSIEEAKNEKIANMTDGQRLAQQIRIASSKRITSEDVDMLAAINKFHAEQVKKSDRIEEAIKNNVHTTTDELAGIVAPATVYERMYDVVTQYSGVLNALPYRATNSVLYEHKMLTEKMKLAWLASKEDDGADGNLKPHTTFSIQKQLREMDHYAGVMVFSDYALSTGAVDLLDEFARQAREAQDAILAELTIGTLETAVETRVAGVTVGNATIPADAAGSIAFAATGDTEKEKALKMVEIVNEANGQLVNGVMIMSKQSAGQLRLDIGMSATTALTKGEIGEDPILTNAFGHTVITVPNNLMPLINSGATTTVGTPNGNVTVDHAIYFLEQANWDAKILNGASSFDTSDSASYEVGGNTFSAYQRNETVVKAYGYAMAQVLDFRYILGVRANA